MRSLTGNNNWTGGKEAAFISDIKALVDQGIIADDVTITLGGCLNGASAGNVPASAEPVSRAWAERNKDNADPNNFARLLSLALPNATIIANQTQVNASNGLNAPIVYKNGQEVSQ